MTTITHPRTVDRRTVLRATGALAVGGTAVSLGSGRAAAAPDIGTWFEDVSNYDGVVDRRGAATVHVEVGAQGNGGGFAYSPAAVRVDPGTTVVWTWTGAGGSHNVAASDGAFTSPYADTAGATYERTFDAEGIVRYECTPHVAMGMKGAVIVGDVPLGSAASGYDEPAYGDWFVDTPNFEGTLDYTGREVVSVAVAPDGEAVFEPAAIRVDPGTTVVWTWDGDGHTVRAADGDYASPDGTAGGTFALTFDGNGVSTYECGAAGGDGMRGAVVVGAGGTPATTLSDLGAAGLFGTLTGLVGLAGFLGYMERDRFERRGGGRTDPRPPEDAVTTSPPGAGDASAR